jgi:hypothetical protein
MSLVDIITRLNRPVLLVGMGTAVVYLAVTGHEPAVQALIAQFVAISSFAYGVSAGSKLPEQLPQERREGQ